MRDDDTKSAPVGRDRREPYVKPALSVVDLFAAEVLGTGCKLGTTSASGSNNCYGGACLYEGS